MFQAPGQEAAAPVVADAIGPIFAGRAIRAAATVNPALGDVPFADAACLVPEPDWHVDIAPSGIARHESTTVFHGMKRIHGQDILV